MANTKTVQERWDTLDKETQEKLLSNVFCINCHVTTMVDYKIVSNKDDIILQGKCKKCKRKVTRLVENEWL
jgi:hypothetical protein